MIPNMKRLLIVLAVMLAAAPGFAQLTVGTSVPDITLPDENGEIRKLSSLKGKVVLVDFWASWCGPCRKSNKQLVSLYAKYKDQGFEIFGVSLDTEKKDWSAAIKNDKITWMQVIESAGWEGQASMRWKVEQLPTSFLIDKDGKLVAIDPSKALLETFLKRNATSGKP
jgi:peroxiredoxin